MLITKSGNIIFEPTIFKKNEIQQAKLIISNFKDAPGILYKITGVLYVYGWTILSAKIRTFNQEIEDIFTIEPANNNIIIKQETLEKIELDLYKLLMNELHMSEYLAYYPDKTRILINSMNAYPDTEVELIPLKNDRYLKILLKTKDRPGLLYFISQILYLTDLNILEFEANTEDHFANDIFIVEKKNQIEFTKTNIKEIKNLLKKFI
ncbi:MAG: hypothetical protein KatS3mg129_2515 [Leptospiraceae bacterium]|nr:MAG: hypothetical protein KatS3mg129_2515 [Leptospiraceae bacterium]